MPITHHAFTKETLGFIPIIWVRLENPSTGRISCLRSKVDTGADACFFPSEIAIDLGLDLEKGEKREVITVKGTHLAYGHKLNLEILTSTSEGGYNEKEILYRIPNVLVYFVEESRRYLVGVKDVLEHFVITIHYPHKVFSIKNPKKFICPFFPPTSELK
jgi:hypothetical protein